jgi:HK97 family phage portal protein
MSFFDWILSFRKQLSAPGIFISNPSPITEVQAEGSKTLASVYAAIHAYSDSISTAPLGIFTDEDDPQPQKDHMLWPILAAEMNSEQTPQQALSYMIESLFARGNAYAQIRSDAAGTVYDLIPQNPTWVKPRRENGKIIYKITQPGRSSLDIPAEEMIDVTINYDPVSLRGRAPLAYASRSVMLGIALDNFGLSFFQSGGQGRTILEAPGTLNAAQAEQLLSNWNAQYANMDGSNRTALLTGGVKANRQQIAPEDSQFLQSRKFTVNEVARWFNLPPSRIGGDRASGTYANMEQDQLALVIHSLQPVCNMFEQELNRKLLTPSERGKLRIRFDLSKMLVSLGAAPQAEPDAGEMDDDEESAAKPIKEEEQ